MPQPMKEDVGPNIVTDDPALELFSERVGRAFTQHRRRKNAAPQCWRTYAGDVWPTRAASDVREKDRTPPVSINLVLPTVNTLLGDQMVNRREVVFKPSDLSKHDDVVANWMTRIARHYFQRANAHRDESRAILEQLVTGMGWMHVYVDFRSGEPAIGFDYVTDNEMWFDGDARKDNAADARYVLRRTEWDRRDAILRWPQHKLKFETTSGHSQPYPDQNQVVLWGQHGGDGENSVSKPDIVEIWEYQYKEPEPYVAYYPNIEDPETGEVTVSNTIQRLPEKEFNEMFPAESRVTYVDLMDPEREQKTVNLAEWADLLESEGGTRYQEVSREESQRPETWYPYAQPVYYTSKILAGRGGHGKSSTASYWIEKPRPMRLSRFNYVPFNGFWRNNPNEKQIEHFGLVSTIDQTQLLIAKVLTQTVQMLAVSHKSGGLVNAGLFADPQKFQEQQGRPGFWHLINRPVQTGDMEPFPSPTFPNFHGELLNRLFDAIPAQTAVTDYLTGTEQRERSEVLVSNLQSRAKTTLAPLLDPVESGRTIIGRLEMEIVRNFIQPQSIQRILGDDAEVEGVTYEMQQDPETGEEVRVEIATAAQILKRRDVGEFDVVVDTGEANTHEKSAILSVMGQLMSNIEVLPVELQEMLFTILVRAMPLPKGQASEFAEEFSRTREQRQRMATVDGIMGMLETLAPEDLEQIVAQGEAVLEQFAPPPEEAGTEQVAAEQMPPQTM